MPVYQLPDEIIFPHPGLAEEDGLLAIGGDLSIERLLLAYSNGIFPWYSDDSPIMWWALNPRMVLYPEKLKVSKSLQQTLNSKKFQVYFDKDFKAVIHNCSKSERPHQDGTWITDEMKQAYIAMHNEGFAHSVETYYKDELVGGLYGVSLGRIFFGESMFFKKSDASKVALFALVERLKIWDFDLIDAQQETRHLKSLGAELLALNDFLGILEKSLKHPTQRGNWGI